MASPDHHFSGETNDSPCDAGIGGGELCGRPRDEHLGKNRRRLPQTNRVWIRDFDEWMRLGIERGYCGPPVCATHDGTPYSDEEEDAFEAGEDPCFHIVRLYESPEQKASVEGNHPPSVWRNTYDTNPKSWPDTDPELREATEEMMRERTKRPLVDYYWEKQNLPPGATVLDTQTGEVHQEPGSWADNYSPPNPEAKP